MEILGLAFGGREIRGIDFGDKVDSVICWNDFGGFVLATLGLERGGHVDLVCVLMDLKQIMHNNADVGCRIESLFVLVW